MTLEGWVASWGLCPGMTCRGLCGSQQLRVPQDWRGESGTSFWGFKMEAEKAPCRAARQDVTPGTGPVSLTGGCCCPRARCHTLPSRAPAEKPLRGFVVPVGRGLAQPSSPPHHQGMAKVLKIPPRCLNSSWEHRRRRRRRAGGLLSLPLAGICHAGEGTASSSREIRGSGQP